MLDIILIYLLYKSLLKRFDKARKDAISKATSAKEAVALRKRFTAERKRFAYIYFALLPFLDVAFWTLIALSDGWNGGAYLFAGIVSVCFAYVLLYVHLRHQVERTEVFGNISYWETDDYLREHPRFAVYLRGFASDTPFGDSHPSDAFDEAVFTEVVDYALGLPMCALGMSKEVDAPLGAERIYVEDESWKDEVLRLMHAAEKIFILVNNRESCVWEISQCKDLLDKTVFIVDDPKQYASCSSSLNELFPSPALEDGQGAPFYFTHEVPPTVFENDRSGYFKILGIDEEKLEAEKVEQRRHQMQDGNEKLLKKTVPVLVAIAVTAAVIYIVFFK